MPGTQGTIPTFPHPQPARLQPPAAPPPRPPQHLGHGPLAAAVTSNPQTQASPHPKPGWGAQEPSVLYLFLSALTCVALGVLTSFR